MFIFVLEQLWSQSVFTTPRFVSKAGGRIKGGFFFSVRIVEGKD